MNTSHQEIISTREKQRQEELNQKFQAKMKELEEFCCQQKSCGFDEIQTRILQDIFFERMKLQKQDRQQFFETFRWQKTKTKKSSRFHTIFKIHQIQQ